MPADAAASSPGVPELQHRIERLEAELRTSRAERATLTAALADRNSSYSERHLHQVATNEVLTAMAASPADPQPVFDLIAIRARDICGGYGVSVLAFDGAMLRLCAWTGVSDDPAIRDAYVTQFPRVPDPTRAEGRAILDGRVVHVRDYRTERELRLSPGNTTVRSNVAVPMRRGSEVVGVVTMGSRDAGGFSDSQVELLQTFAEQAAIAIASAAAHRAQGEALEQQTATADILRVISRSPTDVQPVLEAVASAARRYCGASDVIVTLRDGDNMRMATHQGPLDALVGDVGPLDRTRISGRCILHARVIHLPDVGQLDPAEFATTLELAQQHGFRAALAAPMLLDGGAIGSILLRKPETGPFAPRQIELLETFAAQAVIAIENVRLFTELREALEQQIASGEILQVISQSPTDATPVLDAVARAAVRFCGAEDATISLKDGLDLTLAAHEGPIATDEVGRRYPLDGATMRGQAIIEGRTLHVPDAAGPEGAPYERTQELARRLGFHAVVAAPMLREGGAIGSIALRKSQSGAFTARQITLLETFAAQAVIAIENVRLFGQLREALEQQTAASEILQVISQSPTDVQPVLDVIAERAVTLCEGESCAVFRYDGSLQHFAAASSRTWADISPEAIRANYPRAANRHTVGGLALLDGVVVQTRDVRQDDRFRLGRGFVTATFQAALAVPMRRDDQVIGAIVVSRREASSFTERQIELLETFAAQAVIAIENTRLFNDLRESLERLKAAQANLIQSEKMASLGQLTAGIAHEIKNPLNFVNNFAALSTELLQELKQAVEAMVAEPDDDKQAELQDTMDLLTANLARIVEHGRRADGIVKSMLAHSRGGTGDWQTSHINALVEEALTLAYHGARAQDPGFDVTLDRDFGPAVKPIDVVPQDVTRVLLNLFGNGFYATRKRQREESSDGYRPTLGVSTRELGDAVEIRVRDNGTGIVPEVRGKLFQPFFTTKPTGEGTGLGLSISYDIVTRQHGGTIEAESEPGAFTEFTVRLPRARRAASPSEA